MSPLDRRLFGLYLEECKGSGHRGTANDRGDFTMDELRELAREFLGPGGVESAQPSMSDAGGFALRVVFSDRTLLWLQPSPALEADTDGLPEIADWELFTPYARY